MQDPYNPPNAQQPQQPHNPQQTMAPQQADGFAITSMVLGIVAIITCYFGIILGTIGVIFGHLSLGKIKRNPALGGKGMAIAGLACGYVAIAISIAWGIMILFAVNKSSEAGSSFMKELEKEMEKERQKQNIELHESSNP